jgi:hypothetical protein
MASAQLSRAEIVLSIACVALCLGGCARTRSDDFSVSRGLRQRVSSERTDTIVIRCYCPRREVVRSSRVSGVELDVDGTHSSQGYHGDQEKPRTVAPELLRFVERRSDGEILLESREYTYIHHAFLIDHLRVIVPAGQEVRFEPLAYQELEGRRVE